MYYTCERCRHGEVCKYRRELDMLRQFIDDSALMKLDFEYNISADVLEHYRIICDKFIPSVLSYLPIGGCNC